MPADSCARLPDALLERGAAYIQRQVPGPLRGASTKPILGTTRFEFRLAADQLGVRETILQVPCQRMASSPTVSADAALACRDHDFRPSEPAPTAKRMRAFAPPGKLRGLMPRWRRIFEKRAAFSL